MGPVTIDGTLFAAVTVTPWLILGLVVRMILIGQLVPKTHVDDRIADRNTVIAAKDETIDEQAKHIATQAENNQVLRIGNQTTLRVVEAVREVAGAPPQQSETS